MSKRNAKSAPHSFENVMPEATAQPGSAVRPVAEQDVADLAYRRWLERGCPQGSPEEDWFEAERELMSK